MHHFAQHMDAMSRHSAQIAALYIASRVVYDHHLSRPAVCLTRAELLMRQKVGYLETVNAELCSQLERCDADTLSLQGGLQAEKAELAVRTRQLQEEVSSC